MAVRNVQGLRALAALMVVAAHIGGASGVEAKLFGSNAFWVHLQELGRLGVDLFFVISGFIMIVTTARVRHGGQGARDFIWRRVTRLYPPYLVITAAIFVLYRVRPDVVNVNQATKPDIVASFLLLPQDGLPLLLVGWTLVYEMYFYFVLAIALLLPKPAFVPVLALWSLSPLALAMLPQTNPYLGLATSPLLLEFVLGAVVGGLFVRRRLWASRELTILGTAGVLAVATAILDGHDPFLGNGWVEVCTIGLAFALLVYGLAGLESQGGFVFGQGLVGLGNSSYSLYLTHVGVFKLLTLVLSQFSLAGLAMQIISVPVAFAAAVVGGLLYYVAVEKPLLRALHGRRAIADKEASETSTRVARLVWAS